MSVNVREEKGIHDGELDVFIRPYPIGCNDCLSTAPASFLGSAFSHQKLCSGMDRWILTSGRRKGERIVGLGSMVENLKKMAAIGRIATG